MTLKPVNKEWHNEHLSDAVILKPTKAVYFPHSILVGTNSIEVNHVEIATFDSAKYSGLKFKLTADEKIFGGGERALPLNRRGYRLPLYNNPSYGYGEGADALNYSVPFITSSNGYGLFFDNPSKGFIDIGKTNPDVLEYGASSGEINVYIIFGDYQTILQSYYKLTGTQPLPPRWALGNLMSRFGYTSEAQVKDIYGKMKQQGIPVDAVIFDLFWFGDSIKHTMGNLDWVNKKAWPDPKQMIADFKKEGVQTILVTEPFFVETSTNYSASKPYLAVDSSNKPFYLNDFYFGNGGLVDIFRNDAQNWFWQFYKRQMQLGVEAWWGDLGEPERHPANMYHNLKDYGHKRLFAADEVHNLYGHTWTKMLYNFYAKEYPSKRLFSLNRAGFAGSQRYSIFPWTGDVSRSWSGFRAQLPVLLGMSMSGVPYVHSDAGGFAGGEGDAELYVRWLQMAAFTPVFRPHGTALYEVDTAAFSFPSEVALMPEPWKGIARSSVELRYEFLPYNYTLAYKQTKYSQPLIAPLFYWFQNDTTAIRVEDEFMWGENVLVAPVLNKSQKTKAMYLPQTGWYDFYSGKYKNGGQTIIDSVIPEAIPLFIKEGSFLPLWSWKNWPRKSTGAYDNQQEMVVRYYSSKKKSSYQLFEDDGVAKNSLKENKFNLTQFTGQRIGNKLVITISSDKRGTMKPKRFILQFAEPFAFPIQAKMNQRALNESSFGKIQYAYGSKSVIYNFVEVPFDGRTTTVEIKLDDLNK